MPVKNRMLRTTGHEQLQVHKTRHLKKDSTNNWSQVYDVLPFLWAFSSTATSSFSVPWLGSIFLRSRTFGSSAWTEWRGPRTRPFTLSWFMASNFVSTPTDKGGTERGRTVVTQWTTERWCVKCSRVRGLGNEGRRLEAKRHRKGGKLRVLKVSIDSRQENVNGSIHTLYWPREAWVQGGPSRENSRVTWGFWNAALGLLETRVLTCNSL